jgi:hypothetical protein
VRDGRAPSIFDKDRAEEASKRILLRSPEMHLLGQEASYFSVRGYFLDHNYSLKEPTAGLRYAQQMAKGKNDRSAEDAKSLSASSSADVLSKGGRSDFGALSQHLPPNEVPGPRTQLRRSSRHHEKGRPSWKDRPAKSPRRWPRERASRTSGPPMIAKFAVLSQA